jgi:hypothetical protein
VKTDRDKWSRSRIQDHELALKEVPEVSKIVVIGGVAGGATAASRAKRCCPEAEVVIYDADRFISYAG